MRFRLPEKFPLRFKEMDQEAKAMAGVLVAFAIVVLGAIGLSQGQADTPSLGPGERPSMHADSGGLPRELEGQEQAKKKKARKKEQAKAKAKASLDKLADSVPDSSAGSSSKSSTSQTPAASAPKAEAPASTPIEPEPAQEEKSEEPKRAPKASPKPKPKPTPAPSTLTSARVRALKNGEDIAKVEAQLGASLGRAELASRYGKDPADGMLAQEPAGRPCRYYALAPGEPAPLVRLCFDANGRLLTREFVAPQG